MNRYLIPLLLAPAALALACSEDEPSNGDGGGEEELPYTFCGPVSTCPPDVTGVDLTTPVSFRTDIYEPIFLQSCSGGSLCHSEAAASGLGFGTSDVPLDDAGITALIEFMKSENSRVAGIPNVVESDWENSYLMIKLRGTQNVGAQMPIGGSVSTVDSLNIRNWINNGAQNN